MNPYSHDNNKLTCNERMQKRDEINSEWKGDHLLIMTRKTYEQMKNTRSRSLNSSIVASVRCSNLCHSPNFSICV